MTTGELLDRTFRTYRSVVAEILPRTFGFSLVAFFTIQLITDVLFPEFFTTSDPEQLGVQILEAGGVFVFGVVIAVPILAHVLAAILTLCTIKLDGLQRGKAKWSAEDDRRFDRLIWSTTWTVTRSGLQFGGVVAVLLGTLAIGAYFSERGFAVLSGLSALVALVGGLAAVFAFLFIVTRHGLAVCAVVIEGLKPALAVRRSRVLMASRRGAPSADDFFLGMLLILGFLYLLLWGGLQIAINTIGINRYIASFTQNLWWGELPAALFYGLPSFLLIWLFLPLFGIGITLVYNDRRIRLEGYDIRKLNEILPSPNRR